VCGGVELGPRRGGIGQAQEIGDQGKLAQKVGIELLQSAFDLRARRGRRIRRLDVEEGPGQVDHRLEGRRAAVRQRAAFEDRGSGLPAALGEFEAETALPDTGVGHHPDRTVVTLLCPLQTAQENGELVDASHEVRTVRLGTETLGGRTLAQAGQQEHVER